MPGAVIVRPLPAVKIGVRGQIARGVVGPMTLTSPFVSLLNELSKVIEEPAMFGTRPPFCAERLDVEAAIRIGQFQIPGSLNDQPAGFKWEREVVCSPGLRQANGLHV